jgi:small redox-active disulfide protein 2
MKDIKVLGSGCSNCKATVKIIEEVASSKREAIAMEKIEDMQKIVSYSVMSTPAIVIDGKVVHAGGIPSRSKVESWF